MMARSLWILVLVHLVIRIESFSLGGLFGGGQIGASKFKCYSTYELVAVTTYETQYDEVLEN
jgi:hypothetical protein